MKHSIQSATIMFGSFILMMYVNVSDVINNIPAMIAIVKIMFISVEMKRKRSVNVFLLMF